MLFHDRQDAGRRLAAALKTLALGPETLILGLPRGGVVVAAVIAEELRYPLDLIAPRKIGAPNNRELAIGAIAGDQVILHHDLIASLGVSSAYIESEIAKEQEEAARRLAVYRKGRPPLSLQGKTVIVVDDGIATGATMLASLRYLKNRARRCIAAVPVAPPDTLERLRLEGVEILALYAPTPFYAVGQFYSDFPQVADSEVIAALNPN